MGLSRVRYGHIYQAIKEEHRYPIKALCQLGKVSRAAYYKWLHRENTAYEAENERKENGIMGSVLLAKKRW